MLFDGEFDDQLWQIYAIDPFQLIHLVILQKFLAAKPKEQVETEAQKAAKMH